MANAASGRGSMKRLMAIRLSDNTNSSAPQAAGRRSHRVAPPRSRRSGSQRANCGSAALSQASSRAAAVSGARVCGHHHRLVAYQADGRTLQQSPAVDRERVRDTRRSWGRGRTQVEFDRDHLPHHQVDLALLRLEQVAILVEQFDHQVEATGRQVVQRYHRNAAGVEGSLARGRYGRVRAFGQNADPNERSQSLGQDGSGIGRS